MLCVYKNVLSSKRIVLASTSARRRDILGALQDHVGFKLEPVESSFDEDKNRSTETDPKKFTCWTAAQKAKAVAEDLKKNSHPPDFIIGGDTVIVYNGEIIGKPKSPEHAKEMLKKLSGKLHDVISGVTILYRVNDDYQEATFCERTVVKMTELTDKMIEGYVETGEPLDKAGAYGIQGLGGSLIESVSGDYYNVVGFPLHRFSVEMAKILNEHFVNK